MKKETELQDIITPTGAHLRLSLVLPKVKIGAEYTPLIEMVAIEVDGGFRKRGVCALTLQDAIKVADTLQGMVASAITGKEGAA